MSKINVVDERLVEKILKQGQKLRNAMISSILNNDPFNIDMIYRNQFNTPVTSGVELCSVKNDNSKTLDQKRLEAFIKGECMTKEEEKLALDTLRSLSAPDLYNTTKRSLQSTTANTCGCYTCEIYNSTYFNCNSNQISHLHPEVDTLSYQITKDMQEKYVAKNSFFIKYADSLKISISSLTLNKKGNEKVFLCEKVTHNAAQCFFIEYEIPEQVIPKKQVRNKSDKYVRLCSKRVNDIVNFKHVRVHTLRNLDNRINLSECFINFKISYRNHKQKISNLLGCASFNFGSFLSTKNLTYSKALVVFLNNAPINIGTLRVSLQLGCGNLYYGQEFIDAINSSKDNNSVILESDDSLHSIGRQNILKYKKLDETVRDQPIDKSKSKNQDGFLPTNVELKTEALKETHLNVDDTTNCEKKLHWETNLKETQTRAITNFIDNTEKDILFGFLYISEVQFLNKHTSTYLTFKPFCQPETSISKVITSSYNPVFNFFQIVPLIFDNDLLLNLRENYMVIEFWNKDDTTDSIIGLTKIPLHQFYLAYRNPIIIKHLSKNKLPIIGTDWYEPIYTENKQDVLGQVQVLIALGTEEQINNLKLERGFTSNFVKAKFPQIERVTTEVAQKLNLSPKKEELAKNPINISFCEQPTNTLITPIVKEKIITKRDVSVQSDCNMEEKNNTTEKVNLTQDIFGCLLSQMMSQRQQNIHVESSTNTEPVDEKNHCTDNINQAQSKTNFELKKTTDLLDTLQNALSLDSPSKVSIVSPDTFKASVAVISANHLPSRKKCKVKKQRNRSLKHDDNILPSCYVTFETSVNGGLKVTPVVTRNTNPSWNYKCNINLPLDLLTNNQKRLIFKVWKKSTNTLTVPNMQTDVVLGFAAIDLTVLLAGFANVQGWYNIIDFSGKCNGQINIHVTPLENLSQYQSQNYTSNKLQQLSTTGTIKEELQKDPVEPSELLSRTLKRKFIELDEITQRLRLRLSKVTNEDSDTSSDGVTDEFEKDINTLCIEEDFDLINFEDEARKLNATKENTKSGNCEYSSQHLLTLNEHAASKNYSLTHVEDCGASGSNNSNLSVASSKTSLDYRRIGSTEKSLDQHFQEGKQKINTLLEKLTLLSAEANSPFTSRYVSGCSISNEVNSKTNLDMETFLNELDHSSRPNIQSSLGFDPLKFQQLYGETSLNNKSEGSSSLQTSNSDTSLITNFSDGRPAPDGEGNMSSETVSKIIE